jgi:hypothetical protein
MEIERESSLFGKRNFYRTKAKQRKKQNSSLTNLKPLNARQNQPLKYLKSLESV